MGTQGCRRACWDRWPRGACSSLPLPRQKPFPPKCKTGWNPSRASLNKQSTEQSELLSTSHINIDCHVDARRSVACPPPVAPPRSPGQAWERFRGQGHNTGAMPTAAGFGLPLGDGHTRSSHASGQDKQLPRDPLLLQGPVPHNPSSPLTYEGSFTSLGAQ